MKINGSCGNAGMEERIAAAVGFETPPQIAPSLNLVHGFVLDQALEDDRRRLPVDPLQRRESRD